MREVRSLGLLPGILGSVMDNKGKPQEWKSQSTAFQPSPLQEKARCNTSCPSYSCSGDGEKLYLDKPFGGRSLCMEIFDYFCCFGWERSGGCCRNFMEVNVLSVGCELDFLSVDSDNCWCPPISWAHNPLPSRWKNANVGAKSRGGPEATEGRILKSLSLFKVWLSG